jgi:hypothetical protein
MRPLLFAAAASAGVMAMASSASAVDFQFGEVTAKLNATVSAGIGIRTSNHDCSLISVKNGGCTNGTGTSISATEDDGNINVGQWQPYTTMAKITSDLEFRYQNLGAFFRAKAYYDYWGAQKLGERSSGYGTQPLDNAIRGDATSKNNRAGHGIRLLDAFVFGNFNVGDLPLTLRAGNQVVNWGESLFIQGGINSYMPFDVAAIRTPGAELKEALLPTPTLYASLGLPANFSVEAFYNVDWTRTQLDQAGTFFGSDVLGEGAAYTIRSTAATDYFDGISSAAWLPREANDEPRSQGQFGLAARYYADWLNDGTDMGVYYTNFHSKLPVYTLSANLLAAPYYKAQYADDIHMWGASFNTTVEGVALAGEVSYSPNMAYQEDTVNLTANTYALLCSLGAFGPVPPGFCASLNGGRAIATSGTTPGYERMKAWTGQLQTLSTLASSHPAVELIDASQIILLANAGFQYIPDARDHFLAIPRSNTYHFSSFVSSQVFPGQAGACPAQVGPVMGGACTGAEYADPFSWGYRLVAIAQYDNVFGTAWSVSPSIQFAHDVDGISAGPIGPGFIQGKKTVSLGVTGTYQKAWSTSVRWTSSFGNKYRNFLYDKDFATFDVSYAF